MKELGRLLSYARRYAPHLAGSFVLMAAAGASQGTMALLTKPIFDKVLSTRPATGLTPLLPHRIFGHQV